MPKGSPISSSGKRALEVALQDGLAERPVGVGETGGGREHVESVDVRYTYT